MTKCGTQQNHVFVMSLIYIGILTNFEICCVPLIDLDQFSETASLYYF